MDFVKSLSGGQKDANQQQGQQQGQNVTSGGSGGGLMGKLNEFGGGGAKGEKNEDMLDKGIDFVQERMGGGDQSNESALEQAKDEQIANYIRSGYKGATGSEFPIHKKN